TQLAVAKDRVYGLLVHPTVCVLPAVLVLAETKPATGKDSLLAYHLGVEFDCKIAEAISPRHYEDGFHSTGTCGAFGSTAACAIRSEHIRAEPVEQAEVGTNRNLPHAIIRPQPQDRLAAKFRMEYCLASLLRGGKGGLGEFTGCVVKRPAVQELI